MKDKEWKLLFDLYDNKENRDLNEETVKNLTNRELIKGKSIGVDLELDNFELKTKGIEFVQTERNHREKVKTNKILAVLTAFLAVTAGLEIIITSYRFNFYGDNSFRIASLTVVLGALFFYLKVLEPFKILVKELKNLRNLFR